MTDPALTPALARVRAGALCAGCGACAALAPGRVEMAVSGAGFLRPHQTGPVDAATDAAIAAVCPKLPRRNTRTCRGSRRAKRRISSRVPSVEPSSTSTIS